MRWSRTLWLAASSCLMLTATAATQTLVELAEEEEARRAEIARSGQAAELVDAVALSKFRADAVTAVEISGSATLRPQAEPAELGRPLLENPNRATELTPPSSGSGAGQGAIDMGRGWSSGRDYAPDAGGWSNGSDHPVDGRGWSSGGENPVAGGRGWSDRPSADRGYTAGGDYESSSSRGWTQGGENSAASERGWSKPR